jgi:hypothetical protein
MLAAKQIGGHWRVIYVIELIRAGSEIRNPVVLDTVKFSSPTPQSVAARARKMLAQEGQLRYATHARVQDCFGKLIFTLAR